MNGWTVGQLASAVQGRLLAGDPGQRVGGLSLDSRRIAPGEAFLAIHGPHYDAHDFLAQAVAQGAACLIVSRVTEPLLRAATILVQDTVQALGSIAAAHRNRFELPVIAITGSCGKTTTKEFIAHLLGRSEAVLKTYGTQNNHIGLPVTLTGLSAAHRYAVVELGSNHRGEIAYLANIASPTVAVITNVGPAHLEFFGSLIDVLQEKTSLLESLRPGGVAVLPGDQMEVLLEAKRRLPPKTRVLTFGTSERCEVQGLDVRREGTGISMRVRGILGRFHLPLPGAHNVENALAALACLKALGHPLEEAQERLASCGALPLRSQVIRSNGLTIVNDCYNANPLSFARALEILRDLDVKRKVVVAGDMLELGIYAQAAHRAIGRLAAQLGMHVIIGVGHFADDIARGASEIDCSRSITCRTVDELRRILPAILQEGDGLLIKGSRKLRLEEVTEGLAQSNAEQHVSAA